MNFMVNLYGTFTDNVGYLFYYIFILFYLEKACKRQNFILCNLGCDSVTEPSSFRAVLENCYIT